MSKPNPAPAALRILLVSAAFFGASASAAGALAAQAKADPFDREDPGVKETYRQAIKDGVSEYDAHHFEEALGYFRRAHALNPNARTFRGIGMASFELRDYVTAVRSLTAALADQRKALSDEQRKETQDLLDRGRMFVAVYTLALSPANAQVTIDAKAVEREPDGSVMLGLGEHLIEARADGYVKRSLSIHVRGGERSKLILALDPVEQARPPTARAAGASTATLVASATATPAANRAAKTWLVAGGAAALLAAGAGVYWVMQNSELASCHSPKENFRCTDESPLSLQRNIGVAVTLVAGAAALTMATVGILAWKSTPARPEKKRALACQVVPFGVTCGQTF